MKNTLLILLFLVGLSCQLIAQTPAKGFEGSWNGTLEAGGQKLRIIVTVTKSEAGTYAGKFESVDQGATVPFDTVTLDGDNVRMEVKSAGIVYEAVLNKERTELVGKFTQGEQTFPLTFKRAEQAAPRRCCSCCRCSPGAKAETGLFRTGRRTVHRRRSIGEDADRPHARRHADAAQGRERSETGRGDHHDIRVRPAGPRQQSRVRRLSALSPDRGCARASGHRRAADGRPGNRGIGRDVQGLNERRFWRGHSRRACLSANAARDPCRTVSACSATARAR